MSDKPPETPPDNVPFELVLQVLRQVLSGEPPAEGQPTGRAWVAGETDDGMTLVAVEVNETVYHLKVPDLQSLAQIVGPSLKTRRPLSSIPLPYVSRTGPVLPVVAHALSPGASLSLLRAGESAQDMGALETVAGDVLEAACFTSRGPTEEGQGMEYKPFNEDGVAVRLRRGDRPKGLSEWAFVGVFDQAGGEGSVADRNGAASEVAARAFNEAMARVEQGEPLEPVLKEAVEKANQAVFDLGVGAVCTLACVCVEATFVEGEVATRKAVAVTVGDSRVLWVGADGALKGSTELHNLGAQVAAGQVDEIPQSLALRFAGALSRGLGTDDAHFDTRTFDLAPGDLLVVETDGIGDAHELEEAPLGSWHADQCALAQARILTGVTSSAAAVQTVLGYALDQMADRHGKPDNVGLAVVRVS